MPKQPLSTHLRQYYEEKQPSPEKLTQLLAMTDMVKAHHVKEESEQETNRLSLSKSLNPFRVGLGFSLALASLLIFFFFLPRVNVIQGVSKEIALNHNKGLALEFLSENYDDLENQMSKLDFTLVHSKKIDTQNLQLLGARYCSIQGELAAQLRLQDKAGRIYTLYQSPVTDDLLKVKSGERVQDGLKLKLWQEAGLFFGLAGPLD